MNQTSSIELENRDIRTRINIMSSIVLFCQSLECDKTAPLCGVVEGLSSDTCGWVADVAPIEAGLFSRVPLLTFA